MNSPVLQTIWLIPCYALAGTFISTLWFPSITRRTGPRPAGYVNAIATFFAFTQSLLALKEIWGQPPQQLFIPWLKVANLDLTISLEISEVAVGAAALICGLNLLSQIYAIGYMEMDWGWARFFSLLALFEAGMTALVLCDSLFFSYVILEILTLGTYLLVGLWFNQSLVVTGARDAFLTKRIGDLILLMGVVALLPLAGTWDFTELAVWAKTAKVDPTVTTLVGLALLAGPMGKCAQFPLHLWLDEAMEGPLPSTILRNSVVVATGAWLLVKLEPVLSLSPVVMTAMIIIGAATAIGGTLIAIAQIDAKRALSYLVSAYMGLAFIAVGLHQTNTALLLMFTYAVAISLLVMGVGGVVWNSITQDLRAYGGLWSRRPVSGFAFVVGTLGLIAVPPFGSFWAVQQLMEAAWQTNPWLVGVLFLVNALAAFSLVRTFGLIFGGKPKQMTMRSPEIHWPMALPMVFLMGFVLHVPQLLFTWQVVPGWSVLTEPASIVLILSSAIGLGAGAGVYLNDNVAKPVVLPSKALQDFLSYDLYTAKLYKLSIVFGVDSISKLSDVFDRYFIDGFGKLFGLATIWSGQNLKYSTAGQSQGYLLTILVGMAVLILLVLGFAIGT
jgi:NAD(P)H-quinone oxidoreductase subunit 5